VLKAARLREALSEFDRSIQLYEHYISLNADEEVVKEVYFQLANMDRDRGNLDGAFARLQAFRDTYTADVVRRVVATFQQAEIRREQGNVDGALALYAEVTSQYGRGVLGFNEDGTPGGWTTPPGGNIADESMRTSLIPFAAEALFWQAEPLYLTANALDLVYRPGRIQELVDKLVARGAGIEAAERAFYEVLNMGDAEWAVAAATRLGQLYKNFDADLYRVPAPDYDQCLDATGGNYDACDEQDQAFNDQLAFFGETLQVKALERWEVGFNVARENRIFTPFTLEMVASLNEMDRSYRIGGATNVRPLATSDPFISTRYTLDLSDKLAAFEDFVEPVAPVVPLDAYGNPIPVDPAAAPVEGAPVTEEAPVAPAAP
jgi:tetratricopeptide (TPR) repeat protein